MLCFLLLYILRTFTGYFADCIKAKEAHFLLSDPIISQAEKLVNLQYTVTYVLFTFTYTFDTQADLLQLLLIFKYT